MTAEVEARGAALSGPATLACPAPAPVIQVGSNLRSALGTVRRTWNSCSGRTRYLPEGSVGRLRHRDSSAGPLRMLTASLDQRWRRLSAPLTVVGPLAPGRAQGHTGVRTGAPGRASHRASSLAVCCWFSLLRTRPAAGARPSLQPLGRPISGDLDVPGARTGHRMTRSRTMAREFNRMLERIERRRAASESTRALGDLARAAELRSRWPVDISSCWEMLGTGLPARRLSIQLVWRGEELDRLGRIVDDLTAINSRRQRPPRPLASRCSLPTYFESLHPSERPGWTSMGSTIEPDPACGTSSATRTG